MQRTAGVLLAPVQDARGVYRFNADDVDDIVRSEEIGAAADDGATCLVSSTEPRCSRTADLGLVNTAELRRQSDAAEQVAKLQRSYVSSAAGCSHFDSTRVDVLIKRQETARLLMRSIDTMRIDAEMPDAPQT